MLLVQRLLRRERRCASPVAGSRLIDVDVTEPDSGRRGFAGPAVVRSGLVTGGWVFTRLSDGASGAPGAWRKGKRERRLDRLRPTSRLLRGLNGPLTPVAL